MLVSGLAEAQGGMFKGEGEEREEEAKEERGSHGGSFRG